MVRRVRGVHALSLIEIKKKLLMAQKGGADISELFNTSLWTGTGAARTITTGINSGEGSLVWIKSRNNSGASHILQDTIRGVNSQLSSNDEAAQQTLGVLVTAFGGSGYSLGAGNLVNGTSNTYVGWQFRRAEKFFDIVQYTGNGVAGRQIAHNLGVKPGVMFVKQVNSNRNWAAYHISRTANEYGFLNLTNAFGASNLAWNDTEPTSSNFTVGGDTIVNQSGGTYIAYLFAHDPSPEGIVQCGSYVGNGSATGPVVNLGWRPQYLMIKNATSSANWVVFDSERSFSDFLIPNLSNSEVNVPGAITTSSTGFQITSAASSSFNSSGDTYIYMAIREAA